VLRVLDRLEEVLIGSLLAVATMLIAAEVGHRYLLGMVAGLVGFARSHEIGWLSAASRSTYFALRAIDLIWAKELCIILIVWMAKFGAAYGVRIGIHVGIDVLVNRLPPLRRRAVVLFGLGAGAFFTGVVGVLGARFVLHMARTDATAVDLDVPMWLVYLAVPLGSSLMCFRFLQAAWEVATTGVLPVHGPARVEAIAADAAGSAIRESPLTPKDAAR
jgi:C4-dicarboxylate transporter DctQ subunit